MWKYLTWLVSTTNVFVWLHDTVNRIWTHLMYRITSAECFKHLCLKLKFVKKRLSNIEIDSEQNQQSGNLTNSEDCVLLIYWAMSRQEWEMNQTTDKIKVKPFDNLFMKCQLGFGSKLVGLRKGKCWLIVLGSSWLHAGLLERLRALLPFMQNHQDI